MLYCLVKVRLFLSFLLFLLFFNSFVTLADLKSTWGFRIKCWDLLPELSTSASQKVSFVSMPAGAVSTINRSNTYPLCWVKEWKRGGLQMNPSPDLCALAGQALSSRQAFSWAIPSHFLDQRKFYKAFLGALSYISLPSPKVVCVSLPLLVAEAELTMRTCQLCSSSLSPTGFPSGHQGKGSLPCAPKASAERGHRGQGRLPLPLATAW